MSRNAFIISPIGDKGSPERRHADEVFHYIIEPAMQPFDLSPIRGDQDPTPGQITSQIVRSIVDAAVVVADLTGRNANVYYELGISHCFAKPTVLMVDDPAQLPFDTRNERTIKIGTNETLTAADANLAAQDLIKVLQVVLDPSFTATNMVTEAAVRKSLDELAPSNPQATELTQIRAMLESTEQTTLRILDEVVRPDRHDDYLTLRRLVQDLVSQQRLTPSDLRALVSDSTSTDFDQWILRLSQSVTG